jgi:hypothetical protein
MSLISSNSPDAEFAMVRSAFLFASLAFIASSALAADPKPTTPNAYDPDEKICEKITVTGSPLATRRVCATRSEWERRRIEERQLIDRSQMSACVETSVSAGHGQCHT